MVSATSSLSPKNNIRMTFISLGIILLTHILAVLCALAGTFIVKEIGVESNILNSAKNNQSSSILLSNKENQKTTYDIISDILRNLIPKNIIKATTHQELTKYAPSPMNKTIFKRNVTYIDGILWLYPCRQSCMILDKDLVRPCKNILTKSVMDICQERIRS